MSDRAGLKLPFQRTFRKGIARFIAIVSGAPTLDLGYLITTLIQNSNHGMSVLGQVTALYNEEHLALAAMPDVSVVHGKDFIALLAWKFDVTADEIERLLFMAAAREVEKIRQLPAVQIVEEWMK
jgi:hypothetical protein